MKIAVLNNLMLIALVSLTPFAHASDASKSNLPRLACDESTGQAIEVRLQFRATTQDDNGFQGSVSLDVIERNVETILRYANQTLFADEQGHYRMVFPDGDLSLAPDQGRHYFGELLYFGDSETFHVKMDCYLIGID